jgi:long-chain fatty acid transport protein
VDYATLDLGSGSTSGWGLGVQPGIVYHPNDKLSFGLSYTSPQPVTFNNVSDFTGNGKLDNLKLETPQQIVLGGATKLFNDRLLLESDLKWINWANASGYNDFGWKNEWVASLGAQYALIPKKLFLRAGYNFGNNPVSSTSGFNGAYSPNNTTSVQGNKIQNYYYQSFRTIGFPAVVENHISVGVGYAFNEHFTANLAYVHGFANTITQNGSNLLGQPTSIGSKLSEDSIEVGLTWNY